MTMTVQRPSAGLWAPNATEFSDRTHQESLEQNTPTFEQVVESTMDMAYSVALRILRDPDDAQDAVQDAFLSAHKAFDNFQGNSKPSTWIYRIVTNTCLMRIRKQKTRAKYHVDTGIDDVVVVDWTGNPAKEAVNSELRGKLQEAIGALEPSLRVALVLRDVQGMSNIEAAEIMGITVSAMKSRLHRGRLLVRKHLEHYVKAPNP